MTECLVDLAPLVHWITGPLFGGGALADEVKRWEIVARHKGWHYSITPLRGIDIQ